MAFYLKNPGNAVARTGSSYEELFTLGNVGIGSTVWDVTPPLVAILNPQDNSLIKGLVLFSTSVFDNVGVREVNFYMDNTLVGISTSAPYATYWDTTTASDSSHILSAVAIDTSGNEASSSAVHVTIDNTAPNVLITYPTNGSTVRKNSYVTIAANASDISGINKVEFYVNDVLKCTDATFPYSCNWKVPPKNGAVYIIQAKAYDNAYNASVNNVTVRVK